MERNRQEMSAASSTPGGCGHRPTPHSRAGRFVSASASRLPPPSHCGLRAGIQPVSTDCKGSGNRCRGPGKRRTVLPWPREERLSPPSFLSVKCVPSSTSTFPTKPHDLCLGAWPAWPSGSLLSPSQGTGFSSSTWCLSAGRRGDGAWQTGRWGWPALGAGGQLSLL